MMFTHCNTKGRKHIHMAIKRQFEISPEVIATEAQLDETLLMHTRTLAYFGLDPLGSKLWQAMQLSNDADDVVQRVAEATGRNVMELEPVLFAILTGMERSGLLTSKEI